MAGITLGKYEILAEIGQGGMSTVYKAKDVVLERYVALKVLSPGLAQKENIRARFYREAKVLSKFDHPNIVKIYDFSGLDSETIFIASEYVDGISLKTLLEAEKRFEEATALAIVREILKGLAYIHSYHIIHRDIKPSNILIDKGGAILITDFGVARDDVSEMTQATLAGSMIGTLAYMPFEQINGLEIDHRVDIYSTGVTLYEFCTGQKPFEETLVSSLIAAISKGQVDDPLHYVSSLHPATVEIIRKAIALRPEDRYQTANDMLKAIEATHLIDKQPRLVSISEVAGEAPLKNNAETLLAPQPSKMHKRSLLSRLSRGQILNLCLGFTGVLLIGLALFMARDLLFSTRPDAIPKPPLPFLVKPVPPREPPKEISQAVTPAFVSPTPSLSATAAPTPQITPSFQTSKGPASAGQGLALAGQSKPHKPKTGFDIEKPKPVFGGTQKSFPSPTTSGKSSGNSTSTRTSKANPVAKITPWPEQKTPSPMEAALESYVLGQKAQEQGLIQKAIELYRLAITRDHTLPEPHRELGKLYLALKKTTHTSEAISLLETYLKLRPDAQDKTQILDIIQSLNAK